MFLLLLSFNKTSFTKYHNETLQQLTLKVKAGQVAFEPEPLQAFAVKTRNSFVYNISFLVCEELKEGTKPESGEVIIRLEGNELNNFCISLPVWRKGSDIMIAPLTKFELSYKHDILGLKLSLNGQQKML